jgi:hypothetical protein
MSLPPLEIRQMIERSERPALREKVRHRTAQARLKLARELNPHRN